MTEDTTGNLGFQPARWYACAICPHCGLGIPVVEVVPHSAVSKADSASHTLSCPRCHETVEYSLEWLLERLQASFRAPAPAARH